MNREQFSDLLSAVLPHAKTFVGLATRHEGQLWDLCAYATDRYSMGIARTEWHADPLPEVQLPIAEAKDLARFVKPGRAAERQQSVTLVARGDELHVGLDLDHFEPGPTEVYSLGEYLPRLDTCLRLVDRLYALPDHPHGPFQADLLKRFNGRGVLNVRPKFATHSIAWILEGSGFVGAVQGITDEHAPDSWWEEAA